MIRCSKCLHASLCRLQVYIKTKDYNDALEFLGRTLYLEPNNIKVCACFVKLTFIHHRQSIIMIYV